MADLANGTRRLAAALSRVGPDDELPIYWRRLVVKAGDEITRLLDRLEAAEVWDYGTRVGLHNDLSYAEGTVVGYDLHRRRYKVEVDGYGRTEWVPRSQLRPLPPLSAAVPGAVAGEPESTPAADRLQAHAERLAADPQIEATCAEIDRRLAAGEPLDDLLGPGVTAEEFRRQYLDAPESTPAAERWCAKHRDGWCAVVPDEAPAEGTFSLHTLCGYGITLPWGFDHRVPDCPDCLAVGDGPAVERTPEERHAALAASIAGAAARARARHPRAADTQEAHDA